MPSEALWISFKDPHWIQMGSMTVCLQLKSSKLKSVASLFGYSESVENLEPEHSEAVAEAIPINELAGAKQGEPSCTCQWHCANPNSPLTPFILTFYHRELQ